MVSLSKKDLTVSVNKTSLNGVKKPTLNQGTLGFLYKAKDKGDVKTNKEAKGRKSLLKRRSTGLRPNLLQKSLFDSQGSFCEESNDEYIMSLTKDRPIKNFKTVYDGCTKIGNEPVFSKSSFSNQPNISLYGSSGSSATIIDLEQDEKNISCASQAAKRSLTGSTILKSSLNTSSGQLVFPPTNVKKLKSLSNKQSSIGSFASKNSTIRLSSEQEAVKDMVIIDRLNVFYTGSAGTGKSVLLQDLIKTLKSMHGSAAVAVTASTGLAAVNIGGTTINRFSGIGIAVGSPDQLVARVKKKKDVVERWKRTRVLVIDEISMIDGRFLDKLDYVARSIRGKHGVSFGGIQLVFTGDFFQLPPVQDRNPNSPKPMFGFECKAWQQGIQRTVFLNQVFRQKDNDLIDLLNSIRFGEVTPQMIDLIRKFEREVECPDGIEPTELFPTRKEVEIANRRKLDKLPGYEMNYQALDTGNIDGKYSSYFEAIPAERNLTLKEDTQVMMLKNRDDTLVNGTMGKVLFFTTPAVWSIIEAESIKSLDDDDFLNDMRLVCRLIGNSKPAKSSDLLSETNFTTIRHKPYLHSLLAKASMGHRDLLLPVVRFTISKDRYRYELMQQEEFPVDLPITVNGIADAIRLQIPLAPCWALSIHKAQGQTITRLRVDLRRVFEVGQVYVALSRAVTKEQLQIVNFNPKSIRADTKVKQFYSTLGIL